MTLQNDLCTWENLRLAYQNASRGKPAVAGFFLEMPSQSNRLIIGRLCRRTAFQGFHS